MACIGALIAVLSTVHSSSEQWRVDGTVQLLFAQVIPLPPLFSDGEQW